MISLYFGLPGTGKTTILASHAYKYLKDGTYKRVYCNVPLSIPGVILIDNAYIGKYDISGGVILIDEGTLFADSRDFKAFGKDKVYYFLMHRHFHVDIEIYVQQWDALDRKIRCITDKVYYVHKSGPLRKWVTKYYQIPYDIIIPDGKSDSEKLGEIIQGYCKPPFLIRMFCPRVWRPKWYRYFNSWDHVELPPLPDDCQPFPSDSEPRRRFVTFRLLLASARIRLQDIVHHVRTPRLIRGAERTEDASKSPDIDSEFFSGAQSDAMGYLGDSTGGDFR